MKPVNAQQKADLTSNGQGGGGQALAAERQHASIHHRGNAPGIQRHERAARCTIGTGHDPPEVQAAMDVADIRGRHAKAAADEARANDPRHSAESVSNVMP
jgi:hypothetical protein